MEQNQEQLDKTSDAPEMLHLNAENNGKKFHLEFEHGSSYDEVKYVLSEFRDHIAYMQRMENISKTVEDNSVEKEDSNLEA